METNMRNFVALIKQVQEDYKAAKKTDVSAVKKLEVKFDLLKEILAYVKTFEWLTQASYREMISGYWKSELDYGYITKNYGKTIGAAKTSVSYANCIFKEKIGPSVLDLINQDKIEEARLQFQVCSGQVALDNLILGDILEYLPASSDKPVDLQDCDKEVAFLKDYSIVEMLHKLEQLDRKKLAYLLYIIQGKSAKQSSMMSTYVNLLTGVIDFEGYLEEKERKVL